ncbi:hypothetical protein DMENIID0001_000330 [Sergentomyia squamirostris]
MRLLLVTLFVAFASTNGALPGFNAVTNTVKAVKFQWCTPIDSSVTDLLYILYNGIRDNFSCTAATPIKTLTDVDSNATTEFYGQVQATMRNIKDVIGTINNNPQAFDELAAQITQLGNVVSNYITAVGSKPGTKEALQQIADTIIKSNEDLATALKATKLNVPQNVYDATKESTDKINDAIAKL